MLKFALAGITGLALAGNVYLAGSSGHCSQMGADDCCDVTPADAVAEYPTNLVDVKNTKCIVMGEDLNGSKRWVQYEGKLYHICCADCVKAFDKEPQKFVKALEARPEAFGLKKD